MKVFVMGKHPGWGQDVSQTLKNGTWTYVAYNPAGKPLVEDFSTCRACHALLAQHDFIHRYEEYFEKRGHSHWVLGTHGAVRPWQHRPAELVP